VFGLSLIFVLSSEAFAQEKGKENGKDNTAIPSANHGKPIRDSRANGYQGLSNQTGMSRESLQEWFEQERQLNPNLSFGQFVAANMIAKNHQGLSAQTILTGLRAGKNIGQTLHAEGWDKRRIKEERKRVKREAGGKQDYGYKDKERDWKN